MKMKVIVIDGKDKKFGSKAYGQINLKRRYCIQQYSVCSDCRRIGEKI